MGNQPALCGACPCTDKVTTDPSLGNGAVVQVGARAALVDVHDHVELKPQASADEDRTNQYSNEPPVEEMEDLGPMPPPAQPTAEQPPAEQSSAEGAAAPLDSPKEDPQKSPGRSPGRGSPRSPGKGGKTALEWAKEQDQFAHLPPLPQGWIRVKSQSSGRIYYFNMVTGKTTFTEPSDLPPGWVQIKSRSTGQPYYWNAQLKRSQFERPTTEQGNADPAESAQK